MPQLKDLSVQLINGHYLVSSPSNGAMSLFTPAEYVAFNCLIESTDDDKSSVLYNILVGLGCKEENIDGFSRVFLQKLEQQGWFREGFNDTENQRLSLVYLSVTTHCNMSCIYCYIGDDRRKPENFMGTHECIAIIEKARTLNPDAKIVVTGGEPFLHPEIFKILDHIEISGLKFAIGTNAILIDEVSAERIKGYKNLIYVQVSLDGITPEVHSITRGNSYYAVMEGISHIIKHKIPFAIAPTIHEGNVHEILDIARFAYSKGGSLAPNHLRKFPHAPHANVINLKPETLRKVILETFRQIDTEFGYIRQIEGIEDKNCVIFRDTRCKYICGNGWYGLDINWNGDVYPCHLLREPGFIIGNILTEEFEDIFAKSKHSKTRVRSYNIPKCKTCPFVSTCAGGCRASAWYNHGTFAAEDEFCEILYKFEIDKLFERKGLQFNI